MYNEQETLAQYSRMTDSRDYNKDTMLLEQSKYRHIFIIRIEKI